MSRFRKSAVLGLVTLLMLALVFPSAVAVATDIPTGMGIRAYRYTAALAVDPPRVAGTEAELAAANQVADWFSVLGYEPEFQEFVYGKRGKESSQNVIASKPAMSTVIDPPLVIVGAHYDCVAAGLGADDNASGVGAMLEVAGRLADKDLPYDLVFIAFGAEEVGLKGSERYVCRMSEEDIARTIVMINFDSLIAGDVCYIHAGLNRLTAPRDAMLEIVNEFGLEIITHGTPKYPEGLTPNEFSDYSAFNKAGIPIVAFEATNWTVGNLDGYQQSAEFPYTFWHTPYDVLETIEFYRPGVPLDHLRDYTTLVYVYLLQLAE